MLTKQISKNAIIRYTLLSSHIFFSILILVLVTTHNPSRLQFFYPALFVVLGAVLYVPISIVLSQKTWECWIVKCGTEVGYLIVQTILCLALSLAATFSTDSSCAPSKQPQCIYPFLIAIFSALHTVLLLSQLSWFLHLLYHTTYQSYEGDIFSIPTERLMSGNGGRKQSRSKLVNNDEEEGIWTTSSPTTSNGRYHEVKTRVESGHGWESVGIYAGGDGRQDDEMKQGLEKKVWTWGDSYSGNTAAIASPTIYGADRQPDMRALTRSSSICSFDSSSSSCSTDSSSCSSSSNSSSFSSDSSRTMVYTSLRPSEEHVALLDGLTKNPYEHVKEQQVEVLEEVMLSPAALSSSLSHLASRTSQESQAGETGRSSMRGKWTERLRIDTRV
nr:uncharacterized protein CI109_002311 [Kwoniella shandongensis]KAA5529418.1 hypothetical protein CI109_002311 [Kwoniella shandongensis]